MPVPAWLAERPSFLARLLSGRNALRRSRTARAAALAAGLALLGSVVVAVAGDRAAGGIARALAAHPAIAFLVVAVLFGIEAARRKRRCAIERTRSWLAFLPARDAPLERALARALAGLLILEWLIAVASAAGRVSSRAAAAALVVTAAGAFAGFWAGWFLPRARRGARRASERARDRAARRRWATRAALTPLGFWALAEARWWGRPRSLARWLAPVLLAVPLNASGPAVLGAVGAALLVLHLALVTAALVRVPFAASWWLLPTGVGAARSWVSIAGLAVIEQAALCVAATLAARALIGPQALGAGIAAASAWLALSLVASALSTTLAIRAGRPAASKLHRSLA